MRRKILDGQQFGEWTVIQYAGDRKQLCRCSCGNIQVVDTSSLKSGRSKHCSDKTKHISDNKDKSFKDLTGKQFGVLTAIEYVGESRWKCRCVCGQEVVLLSKNIRNHKHESCQHISIINKQNNLVIDQSKKVDKLIQNKVGDLIVLSKTDDDRYICQCKCGLQKEVRGYSLRKALRDNQGYKCRHADIIGKRFGKLVVEGRLPNQICHCKCDCGNYKDVWIGNLLNNSTLSCGCLKSRKYTKEEVISQIQNFIQSTGEKPLTQDLSNMLNLGMTAIYEYIDDYELKEYINTRFGSVGERDIYNYVKSICNSEIKLHDRTILNGNELDIYIPEKKLAIEFNGNYWHSYPKKEINYHQQKTIECAKQGIRLIHIFEYEWEDKETQIKIKQLLNSILTDNSNKIYARKTEVYEPSVQEVKYFEEKYHLQGYSADSIRVGLRYNDNLVAIMTFGKPRFNNSYEYELIRLCYKNNITIIGGTEKMFKYFLDKYNPNNVITYVNIAKFNGNSYTKLGFKAFADAITKPNYVWVDGHNNVLKRYMTMKSKLIKQGIGTIEETEDEIMIRNNYFKIYDSGNLKLVYIKEEY